METILNYVNGELISPSGNKYDLNYNPSTGEPYSKVPHSTFQDVDLAVKSAENAFKKWSQLEIETRSQYMLDIATLLEEQLDAFALAESIDNGKPVHLAKSVDIPRAVSNLRFFATAIHHFSSESYTKPEGILSYTLRRPLGVVACISPWNLPLYLFTWKIAPALAAGNCVVAKPSEITPMTAYLFSKLCKEAKLPEGVLNIIHGTGISAGSPLCKHKKVQAISFTGSTQTGAQISKDVASSFKKISLEMGGKNPSIIFADCDYSSTLENTVRSAFSNQGQICLCGSRILVESSVYQRFKEDFVNRTKLLKVGNPLDNDTDLGAVVSREHKEKILHYINLAKEEGGTILCGGNQVKLPSPLHGGWYIEPTVIEGLDSSCSVNQEEIFGPVVSLLPFETEDEAISIANSTKYGLAANLWTNNINRAQRLINQLDFGIVWVNCWMVRDLRTPFGGMKHSGVGREGGFEALRFFMEEKSVTLKIT